MSNPANTATFIGRLAADPVIFPNSDGSKKVVIALYVDNDFKDKDGNYGSNKVPLEAFVRKDIELDKTPYASIHKGDQIAVSAEARVGKSYPDKNTGETIYPGLKLEIQGVRFLETRTVTNRRLADRVSAANEVNSSLAAAPAAAPAAQASPASVEAPTYGDVPAFGQ